MTSANIQTLYTPDRLSRDDVINEYAGMVKIIASRLAIRLPSHIDIHDLINVGMTGLIESLDRFDPERGVKMQTYLSFRIKGAMLDELRRMDWLPRTIRQKAKKFDDGYAKAEAKLGRAPTEEEMADSFGMGEAEFQKFVLDAKGVAVLSLEDMGVSSDGDKRNILDCIADTTAEDPSQQLNMKEVKRLLGDAIDNLPERERLVLSLYYYEELNLKEIGQVLGVTESRVCQLHTQALARLRNKLKKYRKRDI
ncbi:MAG: FliA/WhiG family RNA polymerase sigma factor [Thermodesulfobacteriota bacterium]